VDHGTSNFPNESAEYRTARNELLNAEIALRRQTEAVAAMRRALPIGGEIKEDYAFERTTNGPSRYGCPTCSRESQV
jgi:predicted dithiol-disulfide oxidoreductase (DUF899 family)